MGLGRIFVAVLLTLALSACVLPGGKPAPKAGNPITGAEISTTALDATPNAPTPAAKPTRKVIGKDPAPGASPLLAPPSSGFVDASEDAIKAADVAKAPTKPATETDAKAAPPASAAAPAESEAPPVPQSPEEAKCLKTGGVWATAGKGSAKACVKTTRDAGKACTKQTQCEGLCLARSGTCAPVKPLFGCNDIFEADGRRVTLCLD